MDFEFEAPEEANDLEQKKLSQGGRPPSFSDDKVKRITIKLPESTVEKISIALVTTHKDIKTRNEFLDKAVLYFLENNV